MKVYVDKIPKKCEDCCFYKNNHCLFDTADCLFVKTDIVTFNSLSDYTKQVRKEVCEIIWGGFIGLNNINGNYEYKKFEDDFRKFLDQIQGEAK